MAVLFVYKSLGATPLQTLDALRVEFPDLAAEPMTYAGRLDPMAEGVLVVLTGDDRYRAKEFQQLDKTYQVTFALGFCSDTGDVLGMVERRGSEVHDEFARSLKEHVQANVERVLLGEHDVVMPVYSSYVVQGKPLHVWAKSHRLHEIVVPRRVMRVDAVRTGEITSLSREVFLDSVFEKIAKVSGDFRQAEILERWARVARGSGEVMLVSCELDVQSGTYIRSLAGVLGAYLGVGAIVYRLVRTRVGEREISS